MSRIEGQAGWVLHRRPWRETSLLIEYFGREAGRVGLVARGARAPRSIWRGLAEPFSPLTASWTRRGEMGTLTALESAGSRRALGGRVLWCGLYANELVLRLLGRDDPHPEVFDAYASLIDGLAAATGAESTLLRRFELALLTGMGVAPDLARESPGGDTIRAEGLYYLDPEAGFAAVDRPGEGVFAGAVIRALAAGVAPDRETARQARLLMRRLIDHQLGGRPLETRKLFETAGQSSGGNRP